MFWISKPYRHVTKNPGRLAIGGIVELPSFGLTYADFASMPAEHQVSDAGAFATPARAAGAPIQGVRLQALLDLVRTPPEAMFVLAETHAGFRVNVWRREIERLAIIAYGRDGQPLAPELGGPFRLLLPGFKDEARDLWDVALLEFSDKSGKDSRNQRSKIPTHSSVAGEVQGGLSRSTVDPSDPRTIVTPPPMTR